MTEGEPISLGDSASRESRTVEELLEERLEGDLEAISWYKSNSGTHYALAIQHLPGKRLGITTLLLDTEDDSLRILGDNSMWLPATTEIIGAALRALARGHNSLEDDMGDPLETSLLDFSAEEIHGYELVDDYDPPEPGSDWKETEGADEMDRVHEILEESPIGNADRLIRLEFGGKAPWEGEPQRIMRSPDEIGGNYGVEVSEEDDLVIVDVDDLEEAPLLELPETLGAESPHGGVHRYYHVPGWLEAFEDRFGVLNPHPSWGEIRSQDGYVVGPGSELTECKHGCCSEDDPGTYDLEELPIATISGEELADLLEPYREGSA